MDICRATVSTYNNKKDYDHLSNIFRKKIFYFIQLIIVFADVLPINLVVTIVDWIELGLIALSNFLGLYKLDAWKSFCANQVNRFLLFAFVWLLAIAVVLPMFFEVMKYFYALSNEGYSKGWDTKNTEK